MHWSGPTGSPRPRTPLSGGSSTGRARAPLVARNCVEELVCNLVEHGVDDGDGMIELSLSRDADGVRIVPVDGCAPYAPRGEPRLAEPPPDRGGGCGLALVRRWAQILSCERIGDRNRLALLIAG